MLHPLQSMIQSRQSGAKVGIPSYCSANELVLETALARAKASGQPVLIEATANQVNQYGGYTGMHPADFYQFVMKLAAEAVQWGSSQRRKAHRAPRAPTARGMSVCSVRM